MPIRQLAPDVAAKIAAGEVVERPASVVKELIENSIDAGATQIRVDLLNGGLQLIRVTDNGCGIPPDELPLALARHATSKVAQIDDLEHIRSLGFRGEALASIAAVAEVTLVSHAHGYEQGAQISAVNGQFSEVTSAASPEGTTITVRNLFSAVPARLKFLKSRNTEVSHCHHLLEQYALAYPEIRFTVFSEGKQIFTTPGNGKLASVLVEIYGLQVAEQMVPLVPMESRDDVSAPLVTGYTSRPTCYKSTRQYISFFVNRRWVMSRTLTSAVEGAYHSLLLSGRHPIAVINIELDPSLIDVNVHPAKTEIRFLKERRVFAAVLRAVRQALLEEPQMPHWQPAAENAQTNVPHSSAKARSARPSSTDDITNEQAASPVEDRQRESSEAILPLEDDTDTLSYDNPWLTVTEEETGTKPLLTTRLWQSHVHPVAKRSEQVVAPQIDQQTDEVHQQSAADEQSTPSVGQRADVVDQPPPTQSLSSLSTNTMLAWSASEEALPTRMETTTTRKKLPRLRVIGQLAQSYIVTEGEDGLYLIDQHAAHERILLERMVASLKAHTPLSQHLLTPMKLALSPREIEAVEEYQAQLEQIGFLLTCVDGSITVTAVPDVLAKRLNTQSLHDLLLELTAPESLGHTETWEERALANIACKAAIKANYFLTVSEMREMLEQLEQTQAPYSCCHGRPTTVHFSLAALQREFGRR
jgi:DNA mismatch repair protein MutL